MKNRRGQVGAVPEQAVAPVVQVGGVAPKRSMWWVWVIATLVLIGGVIGVWFSIDGDGDTDMGPVVNDTENESVDLSPIVNESVDWNCSDSDDGKDYYTRGILRDSDGGVADYCMDDRIILFEYFCSEETGRSVEEYICPNGCDEGVCV